MDLYHNMLDIELKKGKKQLTTICKNAIIQVIHIFGKERQMASIIYQKANYNEKGEVTQRKIATNQLVLKKETEGYYYDILWYTFLSGFISIGFDQPPPAHQILERCQEEFFIHFIVSGKGTLNGQPFEKGNFFYSDFNQKQTMIADSQEPWTLYWISFKGNPAVQARKVLEMYESLKVYKFPAYQDIIPIFRHALYCGHPQSKNTDYMLALTNLIFSCIEKNPDSSDEGNGMPSAIKKNAAKAKLYMDREFADISVEKISQRLHLDRKYLSLIFKKVYKISPQEYLLNLKISTAQYYITHSDFNLTDIAQLVGYDNYNSFIYAFKKKAGMTPSEYSIKFADSHKES